uniref:Hexosyltransferase n=1 Tax=Plectus sambesii TaxID=2011161 RepID=A0A914XL22_9BILA
MKINLLFRSKYSTYFFTLLILSTIIFFYSSNYSHISTDRFNINVLQLIRHAVRSNTSSIVPTTTATASRVYRANFKDVSYTYSFLLTPINDVCEKGHDYEVVVFVMSVAEDIAQREAIRSSWAEKAADARALVLFVVGYAPRLVAILTAEQEQNNDMIVSTIREDYRNLTLKVMSALEWKISRCSEVNFVFKTDSDVVVNPTELMKYCQARKDQKNAIFGDVLDNREIIRDTEHRWFISNESYSQPFWPSYTNGPGYLMTADVPAQLLSSSSHYNFIAIEDAFLTGVLASHANISLIPDSNSFCWWNLECFDACNQKDTHVISVHGFNTPDTMKEVWRAIRTGKCNS